MVSLSCCDYLSIEHQRRLGFSLTDGLPYGHYARKNLGYLYAIKHGARFIYETDDDNRPLDGLQGFILTPQTPGLFYDGGQVFNPYRHFGQSTVWPRGFPLSAIGKQQAQFYKLGSRWDAPLIQQGIVNGDPDVDDIFRLSRKPDSTRLNVTFDPAAPPVMWGEGVFSPFNSQNTLFHRDAFWALFIPTTTTFRGLRHLAGVLGPEAVWEVGGRLAFFPANAFQLRNFYSYLDDAKDEKDMYFQTERLIRFLTNWSCDKKFSFFQCATEKLGKHFTFVEASVKSGYVGYLWAIKAMEMGYRVKGYLIAGDDTTGIGGVYLMEEW
ncbi:uncharacterized protein LOC131941139 [Physella acuta]|uniref:uncharacterized protein LOC131941139 n=1 Tax=Physella acuta TaxID=109671 RepID=UPI0027DC2159|nr:uncharacterized protein LOC131941139 [Physella acuta]